MLYRLRDESLEYVSHVRFFVWREQPVTHGVVLIERGIFGMCLSIPLVFTFTFAFSCRVNSPQDVVFY